MDSDLGIAQVDNGMMIAIASDEWMIFGHLTVARLEAECRWAKWPHRSDETDWSNPTDRVNIAHSVGISENSVGSGDHFCSPTESNFVA